MCVYGTCRIRKAARGCEVEFLVPVAVQRMDPAVDLDSEQRDYLYRTAACPGGDD